MYLNKPKQLPVLKHYGTDLVWVGISYHPNYIVVKLNYEFEEEAVDLKAQELQQVEQNFVERLAGGKPRT